MATTLIDNALPYEAGTEHVSKEDMAIVLRDNFFKSLCALSKSSCTTKKESLVAIDALEGLLLDTFEVGKKEVRFIPGDQLRIGGALVQSWDVLEDSLGKLVDRFESDRAQSFLIYRSALQFLRDDFTEFPVAAESEVRLGSHFRKSSEVEETIEELDDRIEAWRSAPLLPSSPWEEPVDMNGVPSTHSWWQ